MVATVGDGPHEGLEAAHELAHRALVARGDEGQRAGRVGRGRRWRRRPCEDSWRVGCGLLTVGVRGRRPVVGGCLLRAVRRPAQPSGGSDPGLEAAWAGPTRPTVPAIAAAWARERAPSLARMRDTCTLAVFSLMNSASPIWRFVRPAATRASTSSSRAVSPKGTAVASAGRHRPSASGTAALAASASMASSEPAPRRAPRPPARLPATAGGPRRGDRRRAPPRPGASGSRPPGAGKPQPVPAPSRLGPTLRLGAALEPGPLGPPSRATAARTSEAGGARRAWARSSSRSRIRRARPPRAGPSARPRRRPLLLGDVGGRPQPEPAEPGPHLVVAGQAQPGGDRPQPPRRAGPARAPARRGPGRAGR